MRILRRNRAVLAVLVVAAAAIAGCSRAEIEAKFVPASDPLPRWSAHNAAATQTIDHAAWDQFLFRYVRTDRTGLNRVAYRKVTSADRAALANYIGTLERVQISNYRRAEQFAYWVNLYNAVTIRTVLDEYPVESIRKINDGFFSPGPWDRKLVTVEGQALSLNDIESRILRPLWDDPRTHYVINCASIGCPNLEGSAYRAAGLENRLDDAARRYINNARGVRIEDGELIVSSIFAWFRGDYGGSEATVLKHLKAYADADLKAALAGRTKIDGYEYDWGLNGD